MTGDVALFSDSGNSGNTLRYATLAPIPIYDQRAGTTPAKGNSIVSAKLISSTTVEMQLATAATITGSPADCAAYIAYSNTKLSGKCSLDATSTLLTATLGTAYANSESQGHDKQPSGGAGGHEVCWWNGLHELGLQLHTCVWVSCHRCHA